MRDPYLTLMLGSSIAIFFSCKLGLLKNRVGRHAPLCIALGQLEHAVVKGMKSCQGHKLESIPKLAQVSLQRPTQQF